MRFSEDTRERVRWQERALCSGESTDDFFPETKPDSRTKQLCLSCEVRGECLEYALENGEVGIWGGTSTKERRSMPRRGRLPATRRADDVEIWLAS